MKAKRKKKSRNNIIQRVGYFDGINGKPIDPANFGGKEESYMKGYNRAIATLKKNSDVEEYDVEDEQS